MQSRGGSVLHDLQLPLSRQRRGVDAEAKGHDLSVGTRGLGLEEESIEGFGPGVVYLVPFPQVVVTHVTRLGANG